jgi:hypothetical protein
MWCDINSSANFIQFERHHDLAKQDLLELNWGWIGQIGFGVALHTTLDKGCVKFELLCLQHFAAIGAVNIATNTVLLY